MNGYTTPLAKSINRLSKSARIELLNFHLANGNAWLALIDGDEHVRIDLPTGEYAVVVVA
jgi:hypothetical protein